MMMAFGTRRTVRPGKRRGRWAGLLATFAMVWPLIASSPAQAVTDLTTFTLDGSPGEPILHGHALVFTPENSTIEVIVVNDAAFQMSVTSPDHWFNALIGAPVGQQLVPGTYPTTRSSTDTTARLDVGGDGTGCNTSTGTLTVHEVTFQTEPIVELLTFAATYEQYCDGFTEPLQGELRYHSNVDVAAAATDPGSFAFPQRLVGTTSAEKSVTVTNGGTLDLSLGTASVTGPASADFSLTSDTCSGVTLAPSEACALGATFSPSALGIRSAVVHLDDDTAHGARDIGLSGTGSKINTLVTIKVSDARIRFGQRVRVSAHMSRFDPSADQRLRIYAKPAGSSSFTQVASKIVDGNGDISATFTPKKQTAYLARFLGDVQYLPAKSSTKAVNVEAIARGELKQVDGRSGTYAIYDYTSSCPNQGSGCPTFAVSVMPNHQGKRVCFTLQVRPGGELADRDRVLQPPVGSPEQGDRGLRLWWAWGDRTPHTGAGDILGGRRPPR